jgi:hypothetical protein
MFARRLTSLSLFLMLGLLGCTGISLDALQLPSSAGTARCPPVGNVVNAIASSGGGSGPVAPGAGPAVPPFGFALPRRVVPPAPGAPQLNQGSATFEDLVAVGKANLQVLPSEIQDDSVTDKIFRIMIKSSAQAQLDRAKVPGPPGAAPSSRVQTEQAKVDAFSVPSSLTVGELKSFAKKAASLMLKPRIVDPGAPGARPNAFGTYFIAYYNGDFVDRFGQKIIKPAISSTIPDSEIAAVLTVITEYIADLVDPTPVLGDKDLAPGATQPPSGTATFYPGGNGDEPTALTAQLATYKAIPASGCGVTRANVALLKDIANAGGDSASSVSGLVSQSWGGVSVGFGVLGKFSIGDNQTLGTIVKTVAERLGMRVTYAAAYWALAGVGSSRPMAPGAPAGTVSAAEVPYLQFQ